MPAKLGVPRVVLGIQMEMMRSGDEAHVQYQDPIYIQAQHFV